YGSSGSESATGENRGGGEEGGEAAAHDLRTHRLVTPTRRARRGRGGELGALARFRPPIDHAEPRVDSLTLSDPEPSRSYPLRTASRTFSSPGNSLLRCEEGRARCKASPSTQRL